MLKLRLDGVLEHGEEFAEEKLNHALFALGVGWTEDPRGYLAKRCEGSRRILEDVGLTENVVDIVIGRGEGGRGWGTVEAIEMHPSPVHHVENSMADVRRAEADRK